MRHYIVCNAALQAGTSCVPDIQLVARSAHPFPQHPLQVLADLRKGRRPEGFLFGRGLGSPARALRGSERIVIPHQGGGQAGGQGIEEQVAGIGETLHSRSDPYHAAPGASVRRGVVGVHAVTLARRHFAALNVPFRGR